MTNETSSLPDHVQKAVLARLLGLWAIYPYCPDLELDGSRRIYKRLVEFVYEFADSALEDIDGTEPVSSFLERLVNELDADAAKLPRRFQNIAHKIVQALAKLVKEFCSSPRDPIRDMARAAADTAACFYRASGLAVPDELWETEPAISFVGGDIWMSFAPEIHFQISTRFGEDSN